MRTVVWVVGCCFWFFFFSICPAAKIAAPLQLWKFQDYRMKNREDDERSCPAIEACGAVGPLEALREGKLGSPVGKASGRAQPRNRGRGLNPTAVPQHPGGASELRSGGKERVKHERCPRRLLQATTDRLLLACLPVGAPLTRARWAPCDVPHRVASAVHAAAGKHRRCNLTSRCL